MADINTYALGLEFQLQAQPALAAIDSLVSAAQNLQNVMKTAATSFASPETTKAIQQTNNLVEAKRDLGALIGSLAIKASEWNDISKQFGPTMAVSEQAMKQYTAMIVKNEKEQSKLNQKIQRLLELNKALQPQLKSQIKLIDNINDNMSDGKTTHEEQIKNLQSELDIYKQFPFVNKILSLKKSLTKENVLLSAALVASAASVSLLKTGFDNIRKTQTDYMTVTYGVIGSQKDLIHYTNKLQMSLAATREEAVATMKALAEVGFNAGDVGKEGIEKLSEMNQKFSVVTGISAASTARFQREMVALTGNVGAAEEKLAQFAAIMNKTGMSASQSDSLMQTLSKSTLEWQGRFNAKEAADMTTTLFMYSAAANKAGGNSQAMAEQLILLSSESTKSLQLMARVGAQWDKNATGAQRMDTYLEAAQQRMNQYGGASHIAYDKLLEAAGGNATLAGTLQRMGVEAAKAGKSLKDYARGTAAGADLNKLFAEKTDTLDYKLKAIKAPLVGIANTLMGTLVPALTAILTPISNMALAFGKWFSDLQTNHPTIATLISGLAATVFGIIALAGPILLITKYFGGMIGMVKGIFMPLKAMSAAMTASKTAAMGAGPGVKSFLTSFAEGLKAMGNAQAMKGALTLGILAVLVGGTLLLLAVAMNKFGISAKDMLVGAAALVIAAGAMVIMAYAMKVISAGGPKMALAAAILIGVLLALGAATLMAGFGIGFMAKGFAELFKAIPDISTFLVVIGGLVLALPLLALGIAFLGLSIISSAPFILAGFVMLAAAAVLGLVINPVFSEFARVMTVLGAANINPGMGLALLDLAAGITGFMFALMGIAAGGAISGIGALFGVKSPLKQAEEIAAAMTAIAAPASMLGSALGKIASIGDIFKPFIDSVLGRKDEIKMASQIITDLAKQVDGARKSIGTGISPAFGPLVITAQPVRKPAITEDTARKMRDERNQSMLVKGSKETNDSLTKAVDKIDNINIGIYMPSIIELLKRIAQDDSGATGLSSSTTQWT